MAGIDGKQQVVLLHVVAFLEGNFWSIARKFELHRDSGLRLHVADHIDVNGHGLLADHGDDHRDRTTFAASAAPPFPEPPLSAETVLSPQPWSAMKAKRINAKGGNRGKRFL